VKRVAVESPYGSLPDGSRASPETAARNVAYLRACLRDCLMRGEAPFASHGLYPGALDDADPEERRRGMEAGFEWALEAEARVVYGDHGITPGMREGIAQAEEARQPVEYRFLPAVRR
jgi:hypothetical protein